MNPEAATRLLERLRTRLLTALHTGRVAPGGRLPSVRTVAEELDLDPRVVMRLYHRLADEGLVEVRPRSGVYLASNDSPNPDVPGETIRWVAEDVASGAWQRRIPLGKLADFLTTCLESTRLVCACVDEIQDDRMAICREIGTDFGMTVRDVEPLEDSSVCVEGVSMTLREALEDVDLVVVTAFHERDVRPLAEELGLPLVVTTLNPASVREISGLGEKGLVFAVVDPRAERRLQESYGRRISVVTVQEILEDPGVAGEGTLVFTPAAVDAVDRLPEGAVVPRTPILSRETAEALARWMVRLNLQNADQALLD